MSAPLYDVTVSDDCWSIFISVTSTALYKRAIVRVSISSRSEGLKT